MEIAEGSDGGLWALQAGDVEEEKEPLPGRGEVEVGFHTAERSHSQMRQVPRRVASRAPELEAS